MNDLRFAFRQLLKNPGFTAMAVLTLALGIAGSIVIFSMFNGLFLRPLPFREAARLASLDEVAPNWNLETGLGESRGVRSPASTNWFPDTKTGDEINVGSVRLCWCPPGKFIMGSPRGEPERRPGEDQVVLTLTKAFWMAWFEATQGDWKRVFACPTA